MYVNRMVSSVAVFYTTHEVGKDHLRFAYVFCKEDIQRILLLLEKAIEEYNA